MNSSELSHGIFEAGGKISATAFSNDLFKLEWGKAHTTNKVFHCRTKQSHSENEGQVAYAGHLTIPTAKLA